LFVFFDATSSGELEFIEQNLITLWKYDAFKITAAEVVELDILTTKGRLLYYGAESIDG